jgi:hypothetical protein
MKILYLDDKKHGYNSNIHLDFFSWMQKKHEIIGVGTYLGDKLKRSYCPSEKNIKKQINRIIKKEQPDFVITYNAGSNNAFRLKWLNEVLPQIDLPKFHISTDYCRNRFEPNQAKWFEKMGFAASLFRHKVSLKHPLNIDKYWFPFSINTEEYQANINKNISNKVKKVAFVGAYKKSKGLYKKRVAAIDFLRQNNFLNESVDRIIGLDFIQFWSENMFGLTCSGVCNYFVAKHIQIPAAYSMLVCDGTAPGIETFPEDTYITYNADNIKELKPKILYHINNPKITKKKIDILHKHVLRNHSHSQRERELVKIVKKYL